MEDSTVMLLGCSSLDVQPDAHKLTHFVCVNVRLNLLAEVVWINVQQDYMFKAIRKDKELRNCTSKVCRSPDIVATTGITYALSKVSL